VDPQARHPSMDVLMAAVRRAVAPRRGRWWVAAGVVALGGAATLVAFGEWEQACAHAADRAAVVWSPERKAALQQRFEQTERSYAADTWQRVQAHVDVHMGEWAALQQEVCEAHRELEPAAAADDPRQRCLDERLDEVEDVLAIFAQAEARTVTQAVPIVYGLESLQDCADVGSTRAAPIPSDPTLREQVDEIRSELRRVELALEVGIAVPDDDGFEVLAERAEGLGYGALLAEVQHVRSNIASGRGDYDQAIELANLAFETALASRHDPKAAEVAADLVFLHGVNRRERAEADAWGRRAEALSQRLGNDPRQRVQLLSNWASALAVAGDDEQAGARYGEALELARGLYAQYNLAVLLNNVGAFHAEHRRLDEAHERLAEADEIQVALFGPDHPNTLRTRVNLGVVATMAGRHAEGRARLEAVLERQEASLGPDHPELANTLEGLASALVRAGELAAAEGMRRRVLELRLRAYGPGSLPVLTAKSNLAGMLIVADHHAEAYELSVEMLRELEATKGADARARMNVLSNLAMAALGLARPRESLDRAEEGLALCRELGCLAADELGLLLSVGRAKLALDDRAGARVTFETVLARPQSPFHAWIPVHARYGLVQTMLADDREAALALARRAIAEADADDAQTRSVVRKLEALLREHG
jgi:tetratricopeptide (TPR) repeat protein